MRLVAEQLNSWPDVSERLHAAGAVTAQTPFQSGCWLDTWYRTIANVGVERHCPLLISNATTGRPLLGLPLVTYIENGLRIAAFADGDITDYNAPLLAATEEPPAVLARALPTAIADALPDVDALHVDKMPMRLGAGDNPLALLPGTQPSSLCANVLTIEGSWEDYRCSLVKKFRKEMERSWRVFVRHGDNARFERILSLPEAHVVLDQIATLQRDRIAELGLPYQLGTAHYDEFFHGLLEAGLGDGSVVLTALTSGRDYVVAGLLGIRHADHYAMVRLGQAGHEWSNCSPGKLVIERTMHALHSDGVRVFDFTTGDYWYKKGFMVRRSPLMEVTLPLTLKGRISHGRDVAFEYGKNAMRRYPRVYSALKSLTRRAG